MSRVQIPLSLLRNKRVQFGFSYFFANSKSFEEIYEKFEKVAQNMRKHFFFRKEYGIIILSINLVSEGMIS